MNAKEIGRRAGRIFEYDLPNNWICRSQEDQEDYGIDAEIELANEKDNATGFIFKAQIKGQKSVNPIQDGNVVSFKISVQRLKYYMDEIDLPVLLVVVDITSKVVYWITLQDNIALRTNLETALINEQDTIAVHIPAQNTLINNYENIIESVSSCMDWLRINALSKLSGPINSIVKQSPDDLIDEMLKNNKLLNFHLYNEKFERLLKQPNFVELYKKAKSVLTSDTEIPEIRFVAGLYLEKIFFINLDKTSDEFRHRTFDLYHYLMMMVRKSKAPDHLRLFSILLMRTYRLKMAIESDFHHFLTTSMNIGGDLEWMINHIKAQTIIGATQEVNKTIHLVNRIIHCKTNSIMFIETLPRVIPFISTFAYRLDEDGYTQGSSYLYNWMSYIINLALQLSKQLSNDISIGTILMIKASYALKSTDAQAQIDESLLEAQEIQDESERNEIIFRIKEFEETLEHEENDVTPKDEIEFFRKRAIAMGMNVDDPEDEFGRIIKQGLIDYNPERVLRNCKYLFVIPSSALGIPARMVGLHTAAMKKITCLKKQLGARVGWSLDSVYSWFKDDNCKDCEFLEPRDKGWHWNSKWQQEEDTRNLKVIERFRGL